ncbi:MAG: dephospho-CoA kinase [Bacteroidota bacterium]
MSKPLKVGITGGIGAGKSIVSKAFHVLGVPIYDADSRAKWLMNHNQELKVKITALFGQQAYNQDGLNRTFIAKETFYNKEKLDVLNRLVHPAVNEDYNSWVSEQKSPYSLKEAALLFETGSYKKLDLIIVVSAPEDLRISRVLARDPHRSKQDIEAIIGKQWPQQKKDEAADYVIRNDDKEMVLPQILSVHQKIMELASQ